jgi:hypothetical protein
MSRTRFSETPLPRTFASALRGVFKLARRFAHGRSNPLRDEDDNKVILE